MGNRSNRATAQSTRQPAARDRRQREQVRSPTRRPLVLAFLVVAAVVTAYHNSLRGPFIFDDDGIVEKLRNHRLSAVSMMTGSTRPLVQLSFAANHALGGVDVRGYHLVNLAVHVLAALLLFEVARRTLAQHTADGARAAGLASAIALIWAVHPLQTESVTYVSQRAESLAGFCALATLYGVIRGASSMRSGCWYGGAAVACLLGMASKPVMVVTPLVVLLYDRVFLAGSWRGAWERRRALYLFLAATWGVLVVLLSGNHESAATAGFSMPDLSAAEYLRSQPGVMLYYLRLALWPFPLVLDYAWPVAKDPAAIVIPALAIVAMLALVASTFRSRPALAFLGAAFFLLIAPSSSVIPIKDLAAEHRMYLPLAPLAALFVLGAEAAARASIAAAGSRLAYALMATAALVLGVLTIRRNAQYQSTMTMWSDVVRRRPESARGHNNLAYALFQARRITESATHAARAVELDPRYADAHNNLGRALTEQGDYDNAAQHYGAALRLQPDYAAAHNNLGIALEKLGKLDDAIGHYAEALRIDPDYAEAYSNRGLALGKLRRFDEAIADFSRALRLRPDYVEVYANLGNTLLAQGDAHDAIRQYATALRLAPGFAELHYNMALALSADGRREEAAAHYAEATRLKSALGAGPPPGAR
jgi:tetratricopeptide (TPR) repeat protein